MLQTQCFGLLIGPDNDDDHDDGDDDKNERTVETPIYYLVVAVTLMANDYLTTSEIPRSFLKDPKDNLFCELTPK